MPDRVKVPERRLPETAESDALYARALGLVPAATQTLAKGPGQFVQGVAPRFLRKGRGARVWDVDGNEYVDLSMGVGPLVLGYAHPRVDAAILGQLQDGITFSLPHPLEVEVSEQVHRLVPGAQSVRFSKTGADVVSAAVRLARAFTGRERIVCCGYHGWHDWYIGVTDRSRGVPAAVQDLVSTFDHGDLGSLEQAVDGETAAVVLEPMTFREPDPGFLPALRRLCDQRGALLVFDEMWTGFRFHLGGAQALFGVTADLACFSKAVANGMPLSVLTGRRDVMALLEREVFFFTTFGGEALSLAAARATLLELEEAEVPEHLARIGRTLREVYTALAFDLGLDFTRCIGHDARTLVEFDARAGDPLLLKSIVQQELLRRGVLWQGFHNVSQAHGSAEIDRVLEAYAGALRVLRDAVDSGDPRSFLFGDPVEPVFRRTTSFHTRPRVAVR